ncbi:MAG: threonine--tRNA ligase, partial [Bacteroidota bacterium]
MIKITLPDGSVREVAKGSTSMDVAKGISEGLARVVLAAEVNGEVRDLNRSIDADCTLKLLTWDDDGGKSTLWHSGAHLMAEALEALYPGVKFWVGPPVENGFYYDVDFGDIAFSDKDFAALEQKMLDLARLENEYVRKEIGKAEAIAYFTEKGDHYKLDLLGGLEDGSITFYTQGGFTDLCRGPHIPNTGYIKAVK